MSAPQTTGSSPIGAFVLLASFVALIWLMNALWDGLRDKDSARDFMGCVVQINLTEGWNDPKGNADAYNRENIRTNPFLDACMGEKGYELHAENSTMCLRNRVGVCYEHAADWVWWLRNKKLQIKLWLADRLETHGNKK